MTVQGKQISVSGTASTQLAACGTGDVTGMNYQIANRGAGTVFIGAATVGTSGTVGYQLSPADTVSGHLTKGEAIYGAVTAGTVVCHVLSTGI